ncbi:IPT/TIG domain-containing protein [Alkaliphilus oremlandii]|uniref:Fibronectin type III domain protein n=1 Tax=Alkaliphilus oremlandii (strain OhILAs) TaxID=350688 RepID=A8MK03_ALKOO|nr:IPT/TIG domain-containing protein [Alkaliphilus oremlandii]ABW20135.1 Fibronectin type III domain protein [Alkaliphilus oremlandii OhILAs]
MVLALLMILGATPIESFVSFANTDLVIGEIKVTKLFRDIYGADSYSVVITGKNLRVNGVDQLVVSIPDNTGIPRKVNPNSDSTAFTFVYELSTSQIGDTLYINGEPVDISDSGMPSITNKVPTTGIVDSTGTGEIKLTGSGFDKLKTPTPPAPAEVNAYLVQGTTELNIPHGGSDTEITSTALKGKTGVWSALFRKVDTLKLNSQVDVSFKIEHRYVDLFTVLNKLDVSETIELIPTQGGAGSQASLKADSLKPENEMSVFFLKSLDEEYTAANMATEENYRRDPDEKKDIFSFTVPRGLKEGPYYVVLTNNVNPSGNIKGQIKSYKILDKKFTVVNNRSSVVVDSIDPSKGSSKGIDAVVKGINIGRISGDIYSGGLRNPVDPDIITNPNKMKVTYTGGRYSLIGENGVEVDTLTREIQIFVGGPVRFREGSDFEKDTYDYMNVRVPENTDPQNLTKDVIVRIETKIAYTEDGIKKTATVVEEATLVGGFTYEALDHVPKITSIVPDRIPVNDSNEIMPGLKISIIGENFLLYRYETSDGKIHYRYPKITLGGHTLDKNSSPDIELKILDKNGREIDGRENNDLGSKMIITIPSGKIINESILNNTVDLKVTNPLRVPGSTDEGSSATGKIVFIKPTEDKKPIIIDVVPSTVTVAGEKGVTIKGQNFGEKVSVYIDGGKVSNVKRNGTGTEIVFDAPPKPEGYVQIIVQNEDGAIAIYDNFLYVQTYTDPKIIDFTPKKGTAGTLVTIKGENLLPPNPLVKDLSGIGILKLIGTRVFLGDKDMNEYHMPDGKNIKLQDYEMPDKNSIVRIEEGALKLSDYHHSVILQDDLSKAYYRIYFDTKLGKILLTDGDKNAYELLIKGGSIYGKKAGEIEKEFTIGADRKHLTIDGKTLNIMTPYTISEVAGVPTITGNRVRVINNNELIFKVDKMEREGYYDVTIVNPDTKKDSKKGNNGFYYSFQPEFNPVINEITPNEGSTSGQYYINIIGDKFVDNGDGTKTLVSIGTVVVDPKDVEVSPDGKSIRVKVPKYPGDLSKETDMDRKTVAVVVVNPDGGSASKEDGFTYIIPISDPKITGLILNKGSAAGGESVIIEGSGFRFYEPYTDLNSNVEWDLGEPFKNLNGNKDTGGSPIWDDLRYWLSPELKAKYDDLAKNYNKNIKPILPKVYFGGVEVEIKGFTATTIEVETPKGIKGNVEVYLVNNDYGTSNKVQFTYEASSPKITKISPSVGKKQGNDKVEITGEGFYESKIKVIKSIDEIIEKTLPLIQFGDTKDTNISNRDIRIDAPLNSGRIRDRLATVTVGNLTVKYDATSDIRKLSFILETGTGDSKTTYELKDVEYDDGVVFLPINLLRDSDGKPYNGYEYVRIMLEKIPGANVTTRLRVDRGFSPDATLISSRQISLKTPSYYTVGKVPVVILNPDGGEATGSFEYKNPDSKPAIDNILKDGQEGILDSGRKIIKVNIKGGNIISILGKDFRKPVTISIGNALEIKDGIEYDPSNEAISKKVTFKMPTVSEEYVNTIHRLVLANEDGGIASSDDSAPPIYIQFIKGETDGLSITKVTPNFGPSTGGTVVTIEGQDFRKTMDGYPNEKLKVYFGDGNSQVRVRDEDIISIQINRIQLRTPAHAPGSVTVKVENPDGSIAELKNGFTYVSNPKITAVVDPADPTERAPISVISILGGQEIKIKGAGFMEGAKVYFNPKLTPVNGTLEGNKDLIYIEGKPYILEEGTEGTDYKWIDGETVTIKTPPGKVDSFGVIVVNPDGGASSIYTNLTYGLPELTAPTGVVAELVYDRFIRIHWNEVPGASQYEIFVVIDDRTTELIGSTELTSFVYNDLESRTRYRFIVKAVGDFGSSKPSMESNTVRTGSVVGPPDEDGGLSENTTMTKTGNTANVTIGTDSGRGDIVIDLTKGTLAGSKDLIISMPAAVIVKDGSRNIQVIGTDFSLMLQPSAFNIATVRENSNKSDAGVRLIVKADTGNTQAPAGNQLSTVYKLEASTYVGNSHANVDYLARSINILLNYDVQKSNLRKLNKADLTYFDAASNSWTAVGNSTGMVEGLVSGEISRLGRYTVIGSRR